MSVSDLIAIVALIVAVAAAWYAKRSTDEASKGNKIALHQPRKEIYDGLLWFRSLFLGMDAHPNDEEIDHFYRRSVAPSGIYLTNDLSQKIHEIYKQSWNMYRYIELAESGDVEGSKWEYIEPFQELGRTDLEAVISEVAASIHVGHT